MSSVNIDRLYDLLKAETDLQQKRVWFCGTLISALLTGWYLVNGNQNNSYNKNLKLILPFLATIIALIQCFLNRGSKYWFNYLHSQINKNINRDYEIYKDNITFPNCVEHLKGTGFLWAKRKVKIPMLFIFFADFVFI
ncbi:MAG: hypothetical protein QM539_09865, partial [Alphaproteobacteria bacterium]|nr:hypothetical protein [Alphaproteobacteria bacterium]